MARKFQFDDEDDDQKDYQETSHIDELENMKATQNDESVTDTYEYTDEYSSEEEDIQPMAKKKKKFVWKW